MFLSYDVQIGCGKLCDDRRRCGVRCIIILDDRIATINITYVYAYLAAYDTRHQ